VNAVDNRKKTPLISNTFQQPKTKGTIMKNICQQLMVGVFGLFVFATVSPLQAAPGTEDEFIKDLAASNSARVITDAMTRLERMHIKDASRTNAIPALKSLLTDNRSAVRRKAARILGIFHAQMSDAEIKQVCAQLKADDWGEVQSGLKALRDLNAPAAVPDILPCLKHSNPNVVRDACRTLAVLGDKSVIPAIAPLLASPNPKVKKDAQDAIERLKAKP
jgi:HEAT repeat protein